MKYLIYPTVQLFLYDLRESFGDNPDKIAANWDNFRRKLPEEWHQKLEPYNLDFEPEYVELHQNRLEQFVADDSARYQGFYYPVRMSDMYGLLLDCSVNQQQELQRCEPSIKEIKAEIDRRISDHQPTLGQTWLIYAQLPQFGSHLPADIAKRCYKSLIPDANWDNDYQGQGQIFGGTAFELWRFKSGVPDIPANHHQSPGTATPIFQNHHVMIILYPDATAAKQGAELFSEWMRLFGYRAKIMWAYEQGRFLKKRLKSYASTIQDCLRTIYEENHQTLPLPTLQETLNLGIKISQKYNIDVDYLADQSRTIAINLDNYQKVIENIAQRLQVAELGTVPRAANVTFLANFSDLVAKKYGRQVEKDYENLRPGLQRLELAIATIRSLVEVERARQERRFQNNITIFGWGLGAAALVSSLSAQFPYVIVPVEVLTTEPTTPPDRNSITTVELQPSLSASWSGPLISLGYSLMAALLFSFIAWLWIKITDRTD
ncbi:MAG TPA: hypothetical protein IGS52_04265 [Oscillatoriaceae cyanobacterium M33_DOE_052]|nr:hypothetical protein [Oscillatoriaceae cyanobacterium M33_DOE_052]